MTTPTPCACRLGKNIHKWPSLNSGWEQLMAAVKERGEEGGAGREGERQMQSPLRRLKEESAI